MSGISESREPLFLVLIWFQTMSIISSILAAIATQSAEVKAQKAKTKEALEKANRSQAIGLGREWQENEALREEAQRDIILADARDEIIKEIEQTNEWVLSVYENLEKAGKLPDQFKDRNLRATQTRQALKEMRRKLNF